MITENKKPARSDLRFLRWMTLLMALTMIGLGVWSIVSQHYFGRTTKLGGAEVSLDGQPAALMGLLYISVGLIPLAAWFDSPRAAGWWGSVCALAFFALLAAILYG